MATTAPPSPSLKEEEEQQCHGGGGDSSRVFQAILMLVVTVVMAQAAYRARREPWDLAFVLFAYAALGFLFLCLSMYERLPPVSQDDNDDGTTGKWRQWLKMAVGALSTALSFAFAWRVAAVMPAPALKAAVWAMTSTVVVSGFFFLFVYRPAAISSYSEVDRCNCKHEQATPKLDQIV